MLVVCFCRCTSDCICLTGNHIYAAIPSILHYFSPFYPKHLRYLPSTEKRTPLSTSITSRQTESKHAAIMPSRRPQLYRGDSFVSDVSDYSDASRDSVSPVHSRYGSRDRFTRPITPPRRPIRRRDSQVSDVSDSSQRYPVSPVRSRTSTRNDRSPVRRRYSRSPSSDGGYDPPGTIGAGMPRGISYNRGGYNQGGYNPPADLGPGMPQGITFTQARFNQPRQSNLPVQGRCNDPDRIRRVIARPDSRPQHNGPSYSQSHSGSSHQGFYSSRPGPDPRGPPPAYQERPPSRNPAPRPSAMPPIYSPGYFGAPDGRWYY